jgi:hypothetical protein
MSNESVLTGILDVTRAALPLAGGLYTQDLRGVQAGQAIANLIPTSDQRDASKLQKLQLKRAEAAEARRPTVEAQQDELFEQTQRFNQLQIGDAETKKLELEMKSLLQGASNFTQDQIGDSLRQLNLAVGNDRVAEIMKTSAGQGFMYLTAAHSAIQMDRPDLARQFAIRGGAMFDDSSGQEIMTIGDHSFSLDVLESGEAFGILSEEYGKQIAQEFRGDAHRASVRNGDFYARAIDPMVQQAIGAGSSPGQAEGIAQSIMSKLPPEQQNLLLAVSGLDLLFQGNQDEGIMEQANAIMPQLDNEGVRFIFNDGDSDGRVNPSEISVEIAPHTKAHEALYPNSIERKTETLSADEFRQMVKQTVPLEQMVNRRILSLTQAKQPKMSDRVAKIEAQFPGILKAYVAATGAGDSLTPNTFLDKHADASFISWLSTEEGIAAMRSLKGGSEETANNASTSPPVKTPERGMLTANYWGQPIPETPMSPYSGLGGMNYDRNYRPYSPPTFIKFKKSPLDPITPQIVD